MHVIIDGVRYMPVLDAHIEARDLIVALIETYMGTNLTDDEINACSVDLHVAVGERVEQDDVFDTSPTVVDFVGDLMERLAAKKA